MNKQIKIKEKPVKHILRYAHTIGSYSDREGSVDTNIRSDYLNIVLDIGYTRCPMLNRLS